MTSSLQNVSGRSQRALGAMADRRITLDATRGRGFAAPPVVGDLRRYFALVPNNAVTVGNGPVILILYVAV